MTKKMVLFSAFLCLFLTGSVLASNELTILPHMIGPSHPETMVFSRNGLLLPGESDSWAFSNALMPMPEGFAGSQVRLVTIYFMPETDEVGNVAFGIGMKGRAVGTMLHYGGSTDTGSPVWLYNTPAISWSSRPSWIFPSTILISSPSVFSVWSMITTPIPAA